MTGKGTYKQNCANPKKCQNPEIPRILALLLELLNSACKYPFRLWEVPPFLLPGVVTNIYGLKKLRHIACPFKILKSGISQIPKKCQNPEIIKILAIFSDLQNSSFKYPYRLFELPWLFSIQMLYRAVCELSSLEPRGRGWALKGIFSLVQT
jgi:hypothetical protein